MSKYGWSLPPGARSLPGEEPDDPVTLVCPECGADLPASPAVSEPWEESIGACILATGWIDWYLCGYCGEETCRPVPMWDSREPRYHKAPSLARTHTRQGRARVQVVGIG